LAAVAMVGPHQAHYVLMRVGVPGVRLGIG